MRKRALWIVGGIAVVLLLAAWQLGLLSSDPEEANLADAIAAEQNDGTVDTDARADTTTSTTIAGDASAIDHTATTEAVPSSLRLTLALEFCPPLNQNPAATPRPRPSESGADQ